MRNVRLRFRLARPALAVFAIALGATAVTACASRDGGVTTSSGTVRAQNEGQLRRLEAFQSRNPEWAIQIDESGRVVAASRWSSLFLSDIRPDVDAFVRANAADVGTNAPGMKRVLEEPNHVRWERPLTRGVDFVDARLQDGRIVITGRKLD